MKPELWSRKISLDSPPSWTCPTCNKGHLEFQVNTLVEKETAHSRGHHDHPNWDHDWITSHFSIWLKCNNASCKEDAVLTGLSGVEVVMPDSQDDYEMVTVLYPRYCLPVPDIFEIPGKCPQLVAEHLEAGFALFWSDPSSCVNRMRVALEFLMDHLGIVRKKRNSSGKFSDLTLHARIEIYRGKQPTLGGQLMALKWLGNTGTHDGKVDIEDVLSGFQVLEETLSDIIDDRSKKIAKLTRELHKKHGK